MDETSTPQPGPVNPKRTFTLGIRRQASGIRHQAAGSRQQAASSRASISLLQQGLSFHPSTIINSLKMLFSSKLQVFDGPRRPKISASTVSPRRTKIGNHLVICTLIGSHKCIPLSNAARISCLRQPAKGFNKASTGIAYTLKSPQPHAISSSSLSCAIGTIDLIMAVSSRYHGYHAFSILYLGRRQR